MTDREGETQQKEIEGATFKVEHNGDIEIHTVVRVLEDELLTTREESRYRHSWPRDILEDEDVEIVDS